MKDEPRGVCRVWQDLLSGYKITPVPWLIIILELAPSRFLNPVQDTGKLYVAYVIIRYHSLFSIYKILLHFQPITKQTHP